MSKYNLDILNTYIEKGLIEKNDHPDYPISIYNYSRECQFLGAWDEITLACRGLVLDNEGNVIARPFKKFFNMEELDSIPNEEFDVYEKMDGSLGILFRYKFEWIFASKGSFTSEQAIKFREIFERKYHTMVLSSSNTYLFEIIYPENRIVVDYGNEERVVLIGEIHTASGDDLDIEFNKQLGFDVVKKYDGITDYKQLKSMIANDKEGFVVRFKSGMRMKIKGDEYVRLHRILTGFSNKDIWEMLRNGDNLNMFLSSVPDEFDAWVKRIIRDLEDKHCEILGHVITDFWEIDNELIQEQLQLGDDLVFDEREYAKKYAEKAFTKKYPHLLFSYRKEILNPINTTKAIWDLIRPKYEKPFWNKKEGE